MVAVVVSSAEGMSKRWVPCGAGARCVCVCVWDKEREMRGKEGKGGKEKDERMEV